MPRDKQYIGFRFEDGKLTRSLSISPKVENLFNKSSKKAKKNKEKRDKTSSEFSEILLSYIKLVNGMYNSIPVVMMVLPVVGDGWYKKKVFDVAEANGKLIESKNADTKIFEIDDIIVPTIKRELSRIISISKFREIAPGAFIANLVAIYDGLLGKLLKHAFELKPDLISSSEKKLSFAEISEMGSIEAAREYIVEREVDSILRNSHADQCKKLKNLFDVDLEEKFDLYSHFLEICERRNLITHNNGIATQSYIDFCRKIGMSVSDVEVGTELTISPTYLLESLDLFYELGVKLVHVLWRKLQSEPSEERDGDLNDAGFELIQDERYKLARRILEFASTLRDISSDQTKRMMIVNLANAHRLDGDDDSAARILNQHDWSATSSDFRLSVAAILGDFDNAVEIMHEIGPKGGVGEYEYQNWPVFDKFTTNEKFIDTYAEVFGEPFSPLPRKIDIDAAQRASTPEESSSDPAVEVFDVGSSSSEDSSAESSSSS